MTHYRPIAAADAIGIHLLDYTIPNFDMVRKNVADLTASASIELQTAANKLSEKLIKKVEELSANKGTAYQCHEEVIADLMPLSERTGMSAELFGQAKPIVLQAWGAACEHKRSFRTTAQKLADLESVARGIC
jgi:geranylgeranyl pyrophosphate synthase